MTLRSSTLLALAAFLLAAGLRLFSSPHVFGKPQPGPFDDLYHLKRMSFSAHDFPHVLDPDPDRGVRSAFCPWPPLYDLSAGGLARLLGARSEAGVLAIVAWLPPLLYALFVFLLVMVLARGSPAAAALAGFAIATSAFTVTGSQFASIDHHYLEAPLTFAIVGATVLVTRREGIRAVLMLALAMTAALFVQTALLIACALAFAVLFFIRPRGAALSFGLTSAAVCAYRLTRPPGYPDSAWFLGWTHAALLGGAAAAALIASRMHTRLPALAIGALIALLPESAPWSMVEGSGFLGGDRWLKTIDEFQPVIAARGASLGSFLAGFSGGAVLVWFMALLAIRRRDASAAVLALFPAAYFLLALSSRRFNVVAIPLLALAGAIYAQHLWRAGARRRFVIASLMIVVAPPIQLAAWLMTPGPDPYLPAAIPYFRAASVLGRQAGHGRVLAWWPFGHLLDVDGGAQVVVDNFGSMPDATSFERAHEALLQTHEEGFVAYCRQSGIRYVLLPHPLRAIDQAAMIVGTDPRAYVRDHTATRLARRTWWWRAFFTPDAELAHFRLIYAEPRLRLWERTD